MKQARAVDDDCRGPAGTGPLTMTAGVRQSDWNQ